MKYLITILICLIFINTDAQVPYPPVCEFNFESDFCWSHSVQIDTSESNWHICIPNKQNFDSAYSLPKAILTDSTGPYQVNDTSSFFIKVSNPFNSMDMPCIWGFYKMDSDSLKDFGIIEASIDKGLNWYNLLSDTININWDYIFEKPVFTGRVKKWTEFFAFLGFVPHTIDTLYYRFTFISDSIQTNKDGWILDNIRPIIHWESIEEGESHNLINIYPNPTKESIFIKFNKQGQLDYSITIYDISGRQITFNPKLNKTINSIDIHMLNPGTYLYEIYDNILGEKYNGKFVVN